MSEDIRWKFFLLLRGLQEDDVCKSCNGAGKKAYGSTSTWHGGIGGSMITLDVCDKCWGSGSRSEPWPSWRTYQKPSE